MDFIWLFLGLLIITTILVLWNEFSQKKYGWTKIKYQVYILTMMFFSFIGYGLMMYLFE